MNIVVLDGYALNPGDLSWEPIAKQASSFHVYDRTSEDEVIARSSEADILVINKIRMTETVLSQLPNLKYIAVTATGVDIVDLEAAKRRNILVSNVPNYCSQSVAQMVFAHLLAVANGVENYARANRDGKWSRVPDFCYMDSPLMELAGKRMGIVGMGNIGRSVAMIARAFGMEVSAYTSKDQSLLPPGVRKSSLDELFSESDVISLHCPLTEKTRELINRQSLALMKPSAVLINTARGGLINECDVADALSEGRLRAYCCDVLTTEPPKDSPLLTLANAYVTPHIAWATLEARQRLLDVCAANISSFREGIFQNIVNQ